MRPRRLPFLIPGCLYALLAIATYYYAVYLFQPVLEHARQHQTAIEVNVQSTEPIKLVLIALFYSVLAYLILKQKARSIAFIGAIIGLLFFPLGTAVSLIFLLWTLRCWPKGSTLTQPS